MPTPQPISLDILVLSSILDTDTQVFMNDHIAIIRNGHPLLRSDSIYHIIEPRLLLLLEGEATITINLQEYHLHAGYAVLTPPNVILEVKTITPQARAIGIVMREGITISEELILSLPTTAHTHLARLIHLAWDIAHNTPYPKTTMHHLLETMVAYTHHLSAQSPSLLSPSATRQHQQFTQFKRLVHQHCTRERNIPFYASAMGVTPHHLSSLIKRVSHQSVMYWIHRATLQEAKILLKTQQLSPSEVAYRLHFPTPSAFAKFFKRETGITASEYLRKQ